MTTATTKLVLAFGGRSPEHDISLRSATEVLAAIDRKRFAIRLLGIDRDGHWHAGSDGMAPAEVIDDRPIVTDIDHLRGDVVFPLLHGPFGEDGTFQGLLECIDTPYVGSGVLASALCMDKAQSKRIFDAYDIPLVPWMACTREALTSPASVEPVVDRIAETLGFPCFIKPANMGSSVGVSKVSQRSECPAALELAGRFDASIVIESGIDAREIEVAVLGNGDIDTMASMPGEIGLPSGAWYDYATKYENDLAQLHIPATLPDPVALAIREHALRAFRACGCAGLARVDFLLDRQTGKFYLNEVNTLPGFTTISMYPKLMAHAGISYGELITKLCDLAVQRHQSAMATRRAR